MSSQSTPVSQGNQRFTNTDTRKVVKWNNRYQDQEVILNNSSYAPWVFPAGTVMGRITSTGRVVPMYAPGADGSQFPVGVLLNDMSVEAGATVKAAICVQGDVNEYALSMFYSGDTLDSTVTNANSRKVRDLLQAQGLYLQKPSEMTFTDNV